MTDAVRDQPSANRLTPAPTRGTVLLLAYHFPPENTIGAERPYRFYKYLPEVGFDCFVITAADVSSRPDLKAQFVPDPLLQDARTGLGWQIERTVRKFLLPGTIGLRWSVRAYKVARSFIAAHPGSRITVLSTCPPFATNLAGLLLSRNEHVRWIADYRDPLGDNPAAESQYSGFQQALLRYLEKIFVRRADLSIANTDSAQDRLKRVYPKQSDRIQLIWNGFDPEKRLGPSSVSDRSVRIVSCVGSLYGDRVITELLMSIGRLVSARRLDPGSFRVQIVGDIEPECVPDQEFIEAAVNAGWLNTTNRRLPQKEAQALMCASDGLILVLPKSSLQVPAKLYEYAQIGRPILAHIVAGSPVERVLALSGVPHTCVFSSQSREDFDAAVCGFFQSDFCTVRPSEEFERNFNGKLQVEMLAGLVESLYPPAP